MKKRLTEEQILQVLGEARAGLTVAETCRKNGISQVTFYKWRTQFGSMSVRKLSKSLGFHYDGRLYQLQPDAPHRFRKQPSDDFTKTRETDSCREQWQRAWVYRMGGKYGRETQRVGQQRTGSVLAKQEEARQTPFLEKGKMKKEKRIRIPILAPSYWGAARLGIGSRAAPADRSPFSMLR